MPNQMPSSSLMGGVQMPPISPRVWKPMAGYRPSSVPNSYARSPAAAYRRRSSCELTDSVGPVGPADARPPRAEAADDPGDADDATAGTVAPARQTAAKLVRRNRNRRTAPPPTSGSGTPGSTNASGCAVSTAHELAASNHRFQTQTPNFSLRDAN